MQKAATAVVVLDEVVDSGDEVLDASEAAASDRLLGNEAEPAFDLVEPGRVGGGVVNVEAGSLCKPDARPGMLRWYPAGDSSRKLRAFKTAGGLSPLQMPPTVSRTLNRDDF